MKRETDALNTLKKYNIDLLGKHRRIMLGEILLDLENKKIKPSTAKKKLQGKILFNKKILEALEQASIKTKKNTK